MAVRQLAGPFALRHLDGTAVGNSGGYGTHTDRFIWLQNYGLIMLLEGSLAVVQPDGFVVPINQSEIDVRFEPTFWSYIVAQNGLKTVSTGGEYNREPVVLNPYPVTGPLGVFSAKGPSATTAVDLPDRRVFLYGNPALLTSTSGQGYTTETVVPSGVNSGGTVGLGRTNGEIFVASQNASDMTFRLYDTATRSYTTQLLHLGVAAVGAVFASELGVVLSLHGDGNGNPYELNVWSLDVVPDHLAPVTQTAGAVGRGTIASFETQVLGANGDWCSGVLVDWTLTGPGTLLEAQSVSDDQGYAVTTVLYGMEAANVTVTASVTC